MMYIFLAICTFFVLTYFAVKNVKIDITQPDEIIFVSVILIVSSLLWPFSIVVFSAVMIVKSMAQRFGNKK